MLILAGLFASLLVTACAFDAEDVSETEGPTAPKLYRGEPISTLKQAQSTGCNLVLQYNFVNPIPPATSYPNGTTDLVVKVKNTGSVACSYKISTDYFAGPNYNGQVIYAMPVVQGPTLQVNGTKIHSWGGIPVTRPCFYQVWLKYRDTPSSDETWHEYGVNWC